MRVSPCARATNALGGSAPLSREGPMRNAKLIVPALVIVVAALLIGIFTAVSMGGNHDKRVIKTAKVGGKTILVKRNGMTLYHLSVERRGHFICTSKACLSEWHPLVVKRGVTPTGAK